MNKYVDTEGEKIIEIFLKDEGIRYKKQVKIHNLKCDRFDYRVADFFIPKYKVYIEFLGKWKDEKAKNKYIEKKEIYNQNNIPCIYIYPDNLGILKYLFYMRLKDELKKYSKLKFQLFKYKFTKCSQMLHLIWIGFFISMLLIVLLTRISKANLAVTPIGGLLIFAIFLGAIVLTAYSIKIMFFRE